MPNYICTTCGTQYPTSKGPPGHCLMCEDERQYIGWNGQTRTTLEVLRADHHNVFKTVEPSLTDIGTEPKFAFGQHAFLVQASGGNVLWDCISLIDDPMVAEVKALGGISAIAISHPHFYSSMGEWSHALGRVPIYLHESNREYVMRPDPVIFPNLIPLPASKVRHVARAVESFCFDRIYGGWPGSVVASDAKAAVTRSAERYLRAMEG